MVATKWMGALVSVVILLGFLLIPARLPAQDTAYEKAVNAYLKKDFATAAKILREYVKKNPDPNAYYLLGYSLYKQRKHAESALYFEQAYVLDPDMSPVFPRTE